MSRLFPAASYIDSDPPESYYDQIRSVVKKDENVILQYFYNSIENSFSGARSTDYYKGMIAGLMNVLGSYGPESKILMGILNITQDQLVTYGASALVKHAMESIDNIKEAVNRL